MQEESKFTDPQVEEKFKEQKEDMWQEPSHQLKER